MLSPLWYQKVSIAGSVRVAFKNLQDMPNEQLLWFNNQQAPVDKVTNNLEMSKTINILFQNDKLYLFAALNFTNRIFLIFINLHHLDNLLNPRQS